MYSFDGDDEECERAAYASKYTDLLMAVCFNYEVMFAAPHNLAHAQKLYELLLIGSRAKNLNIVVQIIEFWAGFKQTIIESA